MQGQQQTGIDSVTQGADHTIITPPSIDDKARLGPVLLLLFNLIVLGVAGFGLILYIQINTNVVSLTKELKARIGSLEAEVASLQTSMVGQQKWVDSVRETMDKRLSSLERQAVEIQPSRRAQDTRGVIKLGIPVMQEIGAGFIVTRIGTEQLATGARIRGRIINSTALDYRNTKFHITVQDRSQDFVVSSIPSANSSNFDVYMPGASLDGVKTLRIEFLESAVAYIPK